MPVQILGSCSSMLHRFVIIFSILFISSRAQTKSNHGLFIDFGFNTVSYSSLSMQKAIDEFGTSKEVKKDFSNYERFGDNFVNNKNYIIRAGSLFNSMQICVGGEIGFKENIVFRFSYAYAGQELFSDNFIKSGFYAKGANSLDTILSDFYAFEWDVRSHLINTDILLFSRSFYYRSISRLRFYAGFGIGGGFGRGTLYVKNVEEYYLGNYAAGAYSLYKPAVKTVSDYETSYRSDFVYYLAKFQVPLGIEVLYPSGLGVLFEFRFGRGGLKNFDHYSLGGAAYSFVLGFKYKFYRHEKWN